MLSNYVNGLKPFSFSFKRNVISVLQYMLASSTARYAICQEREAYLEEKILHCKLKAQFNRVNTEKTVLC